MSKRATRKMRHRDDVQAGIVQGESLDQAATRVRRARAGQSGPDRRWARLAEKYGL